MPPLRVLKPLPKLLLREPSMRMPLLPPLTMARPAASPLPALQRLMTVPQIIRPLATLMPVRAPPTVANVTPAPQTPAKALHTMPKPRAVRQPMVKAPPPVMDARWASASTPATRPT